MTIPFRNRPCLRYCQKHQCVTTRLTFSSRHPNEIEFLNVVASTNFDPSVLNKKGENTTNGNRTRLTITQEWKNSLVLLQHLINFHKLGKTWFCKVAREAQELQVVRVQVSFMYKLISSYLGMVWRPCFFKFGKQYKPRYWSLTLIIFYLVYG